MLITPTENSKPIPALFGWRRVRTTLIIGFATGLLLSVGWESPIDVIGRSILIAILSMIVFGICERWPKKLPQWLARWVLQVLGVAICIPITIFSIYILSTKSGMPDFWNDSDRMQGFLTLLFVGLLLAPWVALAALVWQKEALVQGQALLFQLQRSQLERDALESRLHLLQAQVEPHFLFNTLANVRELVDAGSAQAPVVLSSLINYLRDAVPRLHASASNVEQELQLARSYLEIMQMRIPDRLQFTISVDEQALQLACPASTLLTLVENAIRHGIDPGEDGGTIEIRVIIRHQRCHIEVRDDGVGLQSSSSSTGTGLTTLRERLQLFFHSDAELLMNEVSPHGLRVEVNFPVQIQPT